ncbi:GNAT family N-acetyltransferase [Bacillus cereus]|uniref:GNAT family N-acetyltransferase n=1 Tax=Bacillus cereus TaxID=1396 RepID=UPI0018CD1B6D|nr:GNAT family protein [Bacillus cereus]MBG9615726.1 acetyltransferase [Bacillus cereus]
MHPLLLDFPHEFVTNRLLVRMPQPRDGKVVYDAINASSKELKPWVTFAHKKYTEEEIEIIIRKQYLNFLQRQDLTFLVFKQESQDFVASVSLHKINWNIRKFEIGYWIHSHFSGNGYMLEAIQGIMDFAFQQLQANRLEIQCESKNIKSCAIPKKLGFQLEGILERSTKAVDGSELRDICLFALTRNRYKIQHTCAEFLQINS